MTDHKAAALAILRAGLAGVSVSYAVTGLMSAILSSVYYSTGHTHTAQYLTAQAVGFVIGSMLVAIVTIVLMRAGRRRTGIPSPATREPPEGT